MFLLKVELTKSNPILGAPLLTSPQILAVEIPQPLSARLFQFLLMGATGGKFSFYPVWIPPVNFSVISTGNNPKSSSASLLCV